MTVTSSRTAHLQIVKVTSFRISIEFWHNEHNGVLKISKQLYTVSTEITVPKKTQGPSGVSKHRRLGDSIGAPTL